jgi:hypothetical protein
MSQEVIVSLEDLIHVLYDETEWGKCCAKWHFKIINYFNMKKPASIEKAKGFIVMIMYSFELHQVLDDNKNWLRMMRLFLPTEFMQMFSESFTQVSQMARLCGRGSGKGGGQKLMFTDMKMM